MRLFLTSKAVQILVLTALIALAGAACSREPVVFGNPQGADYMKVSIPMLRMGAMDMLGRPVAIPEKFVKILPDGFVEGQKAVMVRSDFGEMVMLCPPGKYDEKIAKLKKGRDMNIYGYLTTAIPPSGLKSYLAIAVD